MTTMRTHDNGVVEVFNKARYVAVTADADVFTCGTCHRMWDDNVVTGITPTPSGRCPFEYDHAEPIDTRPLLAIEHNNAGRLFIGATDFDADGMGVRSYVLCEQGEHVADEVMFRRFNDMVRLMGGNVRSEDNTEVPA